MNTIGSVYYGWAWLIVAGAGSYYFAKRSINAERDARYAEVQKQKMAQNRLRAENEALAAARRKRGQEGQLKVDESIGESRGASGEGIDGEKVGGGKRYEATEPYRSPKGDRFSGFR